VADKYIGTHVNKYPTLKYNKYVQVGLPSTTSLKFSTFV